MSQSNSSKTALNLSAEYARRAEKLRTGDWVEHGHACGHTVTYDIHEDNPRPGDLRRCFLCRRLSEVVS